MKKKKQKPTLSLTFVKQAETRKLKCFSIVWEDHAVSGDNKSWRSIDEVSVKTIQVHSTGWAVAETDDAIALAQNVGANGTVGEITTILKSCILEKKQL